MHALNRRACRGVACPLSYLLINRWAARAVPENDVRKPQLRTSRPEGFGRLEVLRALHARE